jgi:hypothetical protein
MSIRCGRCRCYHESVDDVRRCANGEKVAVVDVPQQSVGLRASDKQIAFVNRLRDQLNRPELTGEESAALTRRSVSEVINGLLAEVRKTGKGSGHLIKAADWTNIEAGYYAVPSTTGNNDLDFFLVQIPDKGDWTGCLFVKRVLGGHDPQRVAKATAEGWLAMIPGEAAHTAMARYGMEMGRCGRCNRTLTDNVSRAIGLGPDCAAKMS